MPLGLLFITIKSISDQKLLTQIRALNSLLPWDRRPESWFFLGINILWINIWSIISWYSCTVMHVVIVIIRKKSKGYGLKILSIDLNLVCFKQEGSLVNDLMHFCGEFWMKFISKNLTDKLILNFQ